MCAVIPILFLVEAIDVGIGSGQLDVAGGIIPRRVEGLDGVLFSPFLHASWDHLYGNAVPLILVGTFALAGGAKRFIWSTALMMLVVGLGVWLIGDPNSVVVGASGLIFGYLGLVFVRGFVERSWWNLGVAAFIGLLYWYQLYNVLPTDQPVSWQGHLLGLVAGALAAVFFRRRRPKTQPSLYGPGSPTLTDL
jgi:membrane associated rhomboid family serine protease